MAAAKGMDLSGMSVDELRATRTAQRGRVTKLLNELEEHYKLKYEADLAELCYCIQVVENASETLLQIEAALQLQGAGDATGEPYSQRSEKLLFMSNHLREKLERAVDNQLNMVNATKHSSPNPSDQGDRDHFGDWRMDVAGLPTQPLSTFSGSPLEWRSFWDDFRSSVHERYMPDRRKLLYLKGCLVGEAKNALSCIGPVTDANYPRAVEYLKRRYGDPSLLIGLYASKIVSLEKVAAGDVRGFRYLLDEFYSSLSEIDGLSAEISSKSTANQSAAQSVAGRPTSLPQELSATATLPGPKVPDKSNLILNALLFDKLPPDVKMEYRRTVRDELERFDLQNLLDFARQELETREALCVSKDCEPEPLVSVRASVAPRSKSKLRVSPTGASAALLAVRSCVFCEADHGPYKCSTFLALSPKQRYRCAKEKRLCVNCLSPLHSVKGCTSVRNCKTCDARHHTLLCFSGTGGDGGAAGSSHDPSLTPASQRSASRFSRGDPVQHTRAKSGAHGNSLRPSEPAVFVIPSVGISQEPAPDPVFVQVVKAFVALPGADKGDYIFAYLDPGSKRSYVRSALADGLQLPILHRSTFRTGSFGEHVSTLNSCAVPLEVQGLHAPFASIKMQAWTVERLCPPVHQERIRRLPPELERLGPWADVFDGKPRDIDLIIGSDYLWDVCNGQILRQPGMPTALHTIFGWVLSGSFGAPAFTPNSPVPQPSMFIIDDNVENLWTLETLGIRERKDASPGYDPPFLVEDRYQVALPFMDDRRPSSTLAAARTQLHRLTSKLTPEQADKYNASVQALLDKRVVEIDTSSPAVGYVMPHHCLWKKRLRIVFNASFPDQKGVSLNSVLDAGQNLFALVLDLLLRFRLRPHVVNADIEAAFHQLSLREEDRIWVKFVWKDLILRFARVPFGLNCGPALLHSTILHHVTNYPEHGPDFKAKLLQSFYCDNLINSFDDQDESIQFLNRAVDCFKSVGMNLKVELTPQKILGVTWDSTSDSIAVDTSVVKLPTKRSRRELLKSLAAVYDPLGVLAPWTIRARWILQKAWISKTNWDSELPIELIHEWISWANEAGMLFPIPRCLHINSSSVLHIFVDASLYCYAMVAYLVDPVHGSSLVFAKARVAPIKPQLTIPRLELMASLIGSRFASHFTTAIAAVPYHLWSDSTTVLNWISNGGPSKKDIFVSNRLVEILKNTERERWHYVPTRLNPADVPSRGRSLQDLQSDKLYLQGPEFIRLSEEEWPVLPASPQFVIAGEIPRTSSPPSIPWISVGEFSSYPMLLNVVGWMVRFCENWIRSRKAEPLVRGPLTPSELNRALQSLIRDAQSMCYADELQDLRSKQQVSRSSPLLPLHPRLSSSGIVEAVPRTGGPAVPILPPDSELVPLLIQHFHERLHHQGGEATLAEMRRHFWLPRGRSAVKKFVFRCVSCRRYKAPAFATAESLLQPFRVTPNIPFHETGVDTFGPMFLRDGSKIWVLLFTCALTRAVHLELLVDGSTATVHLAFRRFLARRVRSFQTIRVRSDNARVFRKLATMRFPAHIVVWKTTPERSPWWGGYWERLVKSVKLSLRVCLRHLNFEERQLEAIIFEIEATINSRPLTYTSSSIDDPPPLTPSDFLFGGVPERLDPVAVTDSSLRHLAVQRQDSLRRFWRRWQGEYLSSLSTWRGRTGSSYQPTVGTVVLVKEPTPRGQWPLARIVELLPGEDGVSRAVWLSLRGKRTRRATSLLIPLELDGDQSNPSASTSPTRGGVSIAPEASSPGRNESPASNPVPSDSISSGSSIRGGNPSQAPPVTTSLGNLKHGAHRGAIAVPQATQHGPTSVQDGPPLPLIVKTRRGRALNLPLRYRD